MHSSIALTLLAATGSQALWLATANMDYQTAVNGGSIYGSPYCQVGKGDTYAQAHSQAASTTNGIAVIAGGHCDQLPYKYTNQLGGFWDDYGTINYEDSNWHWYCNPGAKSTGGCDAGNGAPKRKRSEFKAQREYAGYL